MTFCSLFSLFPCLSGAACSRPNAGDYQRVRTLWLPERAGLAGRLSQSWKGRFNQAVVYVDRLDLNFLPAGARADQDSNKPVADLLFTSIGGHRTHSLALIRFKKTMCCCVSQCMRSFNLLCGVASHPPCATALLKAVFLVLNSSLGLWQATFTTANTLVLQNASATALFYGKGTHCASSLPAWHASLSSLHCPSPSSLLSKLTRFLAASPFVHFSRCGK